MTRPSRLARRAVGVGLAVALLGAVAPARADFIFLKDGFVLSGQVKRESVTEVDPFTKEPFNVPQGFFLLDDGPRRIYFAPTYAREVREKAAPAEERLLNKKEFVILNPRPAPGILQVVDAPDWPDKWERTIRLLVRDGGKVFNVDVPQRVGMVTPYWVRTDSTSRYYWSSAYLTRELGRDQMRTVVLGHPFFDETGLDAKAVADRRFKYVDFFAQAGWLDESEDMLRRIAAEMPAEKAKALASLDKLRLFQCRDRLEAIKRLHLAGQPDAVRKKLAAFPEKEADESTVAEVLTLRDDYDTAAKRLAEVSGFLDELPKRLDGEDKELFAAAAAAIKDGLLFDNLARLDAFRGQAEQAARQRKAGKTPELGEAELLSLAVTGWLLGGTSAEAKVAQARRLWHARALALEYERAEPAGRAALLTAYRAQKDTPATLEELVQLIPTLPPPFPEEGVKGGETLELQVGNGNGPRNAPTYLVQVPPEYRPGRPYPVLFALPDSTEKPNAMIRRWHREAADNGYLLVAPAWAAQGGGFGGGTYGFSDREHAAVVDVLRDLRRRFNVDSDRVFLFGFGQGALMAWDVGLTHPDLFAGVMPMASGPLYFAESCWRNGQYLPFLVVNGDRAVDDVARTRALFDKWVIRGYPMVWTQYKGRGPEWFAAEVPTYFDWMRPKRRAFPLQQLGTDGNGGQFGNELCTMRSNAGSFYWLTTDAVHPRYQGSPGPRWPNGVSPATLHARIDPIRNEIVVRTSGVTQVTVWLGRTPRGENMIDFAKPVTVLHGLRVMLANRKVTPSLEVLLDDLARRGDRQRLFLAKIELNL